MIARSPGKLVLSGAYSVLEGAPALVAAVDRYVVADGDREPTFLAHEVGYAVEAGALDLLLGHVGRQHDVDGPAAHPARA